MNERFSWYCIVPFSAIVFSLKSMMFPAAAEYRFSAYSLILYFFSYEVLPSTAFSKRVVGVESISSTTTL